MKKLLMISLIFNFLSCEKNDDEYVYHFNPPLQPRSDLVYPILNKDQQVDILWIIDNSGSMQNIQDNIVSNAQVFMEEFKKNKLVEWKMGVISTDQDERPFLGFDPSFPFTYKSLDPVQTFRNAVNQLGTDGSPSEYVFHNLYRMLIPGRDDYSHFFRPDAHLAVIMVTDEKEQSAGLNFNRYQPLSFLNAVRGLKNQSRVTRFYGAFNFGDLSECRSSTARYVGSPFEKIITESEGLYLSACTKDFGLGLAKIGKDIISLIKSPVIVLKDPPVIETLKVYYVDTLLPGGPEEDGGYWFFDKYENTINFYSAEFAGGDVRTASVRVVYDIDDGIDRD